MKAGKLNRRVTIEAPPPGVSDEYGHNDEGGNRDWKVVASVWAQVTPLSGREFWRSQQVQSDITHEVVIRYRPDVRHNQRIRYGDRTLNIESVIDTEEAGVELRLMCKEVV